ncbi:Ubiquitin carboxyl-terminal hydrolase isozyme L5 [Colletotrichum sp. SAR 10_96]|nr:Ubiquitin carboxyl-terminal hydrolase isozyme L5 [Colletotrichum sp. SAR 10_96]
MGRIHLRSRKAEPVAVEKGQKLSRSNSDDDVSSAVGRDIYNIGTSPGAAVDPALADLHILDTPDANTRKRKELPNGAMEESAMDHSRRNPKRKATEAAAAATSAVATREARQSNILLREALEPISKDELQEWEGWCEVESEPAFFNAIIREMGVKDVKVQEVFSVDEDYVATLPQPVYGFIFLYQYFSENYEDDEVVDGRDLWFANQTTDNACATVALTNILMNSAEVDLGTKLQEFKDATSHLSTPLRGHALSSNTFIRSVHNSFTRRMDHLNADLFLENEATESKKKQRRGPAKARKTKKQKVNSESGYHFIAYVPANGSVWELDGLKTRPARMLQFEESALSFNLLALCKNPLATISGKLASTIRSFEVLNSRTKHIGEWETLVAGNDQPLRADEKDRLAGFGIEREDIERAAMNPNLERKLSNPSMEAMELFEVYSDLVTKQKSLMGEYNGEIAFMKEDEDRVHGRQKDHTLAIHQWVQKLADHGILADWAANL